MKELENFTKALNDLQTYLGIDTLLYYGMEIDEESYFTVFDNGDVGWAEKIEELEDQDENYYQEEIISIKSTEDLTAILFDSGMGDGYSWIIFNNKNKIDE